MTQTTNRYELRLDVLAALDYLDIDALALDFESLAPTALAALAADANVTFTNVALSPIYDARFSIADVALTFDASPDDAARYATHYDIDTLDLA